MDSGILTNISHDFLAVFSLGYARLLPDAQHLLATLATLEIFFAAMWWAFDDGKKVEVELLKKLMMIGFFIWVVSNYKWLVETVLNGFIYAGEKAGGRESNLLMDPSLIIDYGFTATDPIFAHIHNYSAIAVNKIPDIILTGLAGLLVLLAYFGLAIIVFITYIEFYMVSVLGLILVPFGVFKHTAFMSEKVFGAVISYGIRLMVLAFILAIIEPTLVKTTTLPKDPSLPQVLTVLLTALSIAGLSWHAPGIAAGLMAGSPSLNLGTVMGTGLAAAAGIVGAGSMVKSTAQQAAHAGYQATKAAASMAGLGGGGGGFGGGAGGGAGGASGGSGAATTGSAMTASAGAGSGAGFSVPSSGSSSAPPAWVKNLPKPPLSQPDPSKRPDWASKLLMARGLIPQDAHPSAGMSVPIRNDS